MHVGFTWMIIGKLKHSSAQLIEGMLSFTSSSSLTCDGSGCFVVYKSHNRLRTSVLELVPRGSLLHCVVQLMGGPDKLEKGIAHTPSWSEDILPRPPSAVSKKPLKEREIGRWEAYITAQTAVLLSKMGLFRVCLGMYIFMWLLQLCLETFYYGAMASSSKGSFSLSFRKRWALFSGNSIFFIHGMNLVWWTTGKETIEWFEASLLMSQTITIILTYCLDFKLVTFNNVLSLVCFTVRVCTTSDIPSMEKAGDACILMAFILAHGFGVSYVLSVRLNSLTQRKQEKLEKCRIAEAEHKQMIQLLLNMLPNEFVVPALENQSDMFHVQKAKDDISILVLDLVGFTAMSSVHSPQEIIDFINSLYSSMDQLCYKYGVEKVRTVGDSYICAGGATVPNVDHKNAILRLGLELLDLPLLRDNQLKQVLNLRIGIGCGRGIYGVTGLHRWHYDITGPAFYAAEMLEPICRPGTILVSDQFWEAILDKEEYKFTVLQKRVVDRLKRQNDIVCVEIEGRRSKNEQTYNRRSNTTEDFLRYYQAIFQEKLADHSKRMKIHWATGIFHDAELEQSYRIDASKLYPKFLGAQTITCLLMTIMYIVFDYSYYTQRTVLLVWPWYLCGVVALVFNFIAPRKLLPGPALNHAHMGLRSVWCLCIFGALYVLSDRNHSILFRGTLTLGCASTSAIFNYFTSFFYITIIIIITLIVSTFNPDLRAQILSPHLAIMVLLFFLMAYETVGAVRAVKSLYETGQMAAFSEELAHASAVQTDKLIRIILPEHIYRKLSINHLQIAESYPRVGCVFINCPITIDVSPQVYQRLSTLIADIDRKIIALGLEKIKRVKTVTMVVTGLDGKPELEKLIELVHFIDEAVQDIDWMDWYAGIDVGPCAGGVVGSSRVCFDMWGDVINTSSRMMSSAEKWMIQVTEPVAKQLKDSSHYKMVSRGKIFIKGKGGMNTWYVEKKDNVEILPGTPRWRVDDVA
ncbi:adenylate/guanylate cyclase [Planoprotostelium fungivorum]|uniref:adenylate cyclase n=1 Tax=Planoprotostelium fungivorum TaxID=1890364 RepID=A0A2P6N4D8_9EUKA|nr:adenylate/guanylate cyclase [Planoprotostelium fungivorum]